jgi:RNA polymerase sigma-70 factor (ECF subfamily)
MSKSSKAAAIRQGIMPISVSFLETKHKELRLALKACNGDHAAFEALISKYGPALKRFIERHIEPCSAEDIYQDTVLAAWVHIAHYNGKSSFKTWLFSIGLNKCRDTGRKKNALSRLDKELAVQEKGFGQAEICHDLLTALEQIDPEARNLLELYYGQQLTLKEIATATNRNLNSVKYTFYKVHKQIANLLEDKNA